MPLILYKVLRRIWSNILQIKYMKISPPSKCVSFTLNETNQFRSGFSLKELRWNIWWKSTLNSQFEHGGVLWTYIKNADTREDSVSLKTNTNNWVTIMTLTLGWYNNALKCLERHPDWTWFISCPSFLCLFLINLVLLLYRRQIVFTCFSIH